MLLLPSRGSPRFCIPPPLLYNLYRKKNENKNPLSTHPGIITFLLCSSRLPSTCPPRGLKLYAPSVWAAPPLGPCMGGSLPFRSHLRCYLLREVLCYRVTCHLGPSEGLIPGCRDAAGRWPSAHPCVLSPHQALALSRHSCLSVLQGCLGLEIMYTQCVYSTRYE